MSVDLILTIWLLNVLDTPINNWEMFIWSFLRPYAVTASLAKHFETISGHVCRSHATKKPL